MMDRKHLSSRAKALKRLQLVGLSLFLLAFLLGMNSSSAAMTSPSTNAPEQAALEATSNPTYYAPWECGQKYKCVCGNCPEHPCDKANYYAWDFVTYGGASRLLVAVADGTVEYVQESIPDSVLFCGAHAGNVVVIKHGTNRFSFYAHLKYNSVRVSKGQKISRGTIIAEMGQSGYAYGVHLHFSINSSNNVYSGPDCTGKLWETAAGVSVAASFADIGNPVSGNIRTSGNCNNAKFVSQTVPSSMVAGQSYRVSITMKNTGVTTWARVGGYKLGSQKPQDNKIWGLSRVNLGSNEFITPGAQKTFSFNVKAPSTPGTYNFRWRMVQENVQWFGDYSPNLVISVIPPPPAAPSNLSALAVSQSQINLSWKDNSNNESGFKIYRAGSLIATVGANVTSYQNTGLTCGTTYSYYVKAYNSGGESGASNTANATTYPCTPAAPSSLSALAVSQSQIDLSWQDNSDNEDGFKIYRDGSYLTSVGANTTSFEDSGLNCGTTYSYHATAYNSGGESGASNTASATTQRCLPVVHNGSFEQGPAIPKHWKGNKNLTADDRRVCWTAHDGSCSFGMVGTSARKSLRQVVSVPGNAGDTFSLSGWSRARNPLRGGGPYCLQATVFYANGTKENYRICFTKRTHDWQHRSKTFTAAKDYNKIVVFLLYYKQGGKVWFDDVRLVVH